MRSGLPGDAPSVFRSAAWVQAWIDTWGNHSNLHLIDLGKSANPLEHIYITKRLLKKIIPVKTLCLAGISYGSLSTPRAEYNDFSALVKLKGDMHALLAELSKLDWNQWILPDVLVGSDALQKLQLLANEPTYKIHVQKIESAYSVQSTSFDAYLAALGGNTRLAYFNRRKNLLQHGAVSFHNYELEQSEIFFSLLNNFHIERWGQPCYSATSQSFMKNFGKRLRDQDGRFLMQAMRVGDEVVSVLFDVIWNNVRYNFQSGFSENKYPKIALGAIHMGYAIEAAIENNMVYDFMAGSGKNTNYKERISTHKKDLVSVVISRGLMKILYHSMRRQHVSLDKIFTLAI